MAGYCETGRVVMAMAPAIMMTMAMTQAKMGRSMKKRATGYLALGVAGAPGAAADKGAPAAAGVGFTGRPGRIFCSPVTMT